MKNLRTYVLCTCLAFYSLCSVAQEQKPPVNEPDRNKPHLFDNFPATISFNPEILSGFLSRQAGNSINTNLSDDSQFPLEGSVISNTVKEDGKIQTIIIRSANFNGATFSMSRVTNEDGSFYYTGRLISFQHGDLYVLKQTTEGRYSLVKKNLYDLLSE